MAEAAPLNEPEVEQLVRRVYLDLFDTHAPVEEFLTCLADEELEMRFPEATMGLVYDAGQTWEVRRSTATGAPVIVRYVVDTFTPAAPPA